MENNINIRIVRPDEETGSPSQPSTPEQQAGTPPDKQKGGVKKIAAVNIAMGMAKQSLLLGASQVGFETGSTHTQDIVNAGLKVAEYGVMFAINPILGASKMAMDFLTNSIQYNQKKWEEELRIGRIMGRSGSEYNRSRG